MQTQKVVAFRLVDLYLTPSHSNSQGQGHADLYLTPSHSNGQGQGHADLYLTPSHSKGQGQGHAHFNFEYISKIVTDKANITFAIKYVACGLAISIFRVDLGLF